MTLKKHGAVLAFTESIVYRTRLQLTYMFSNYLSRTYCAPANVLGSDAFSKLKKNVLLS